MKCRHCKLELSSTFLDLGFAPPSNAYLCEEGLSRSEEYYPLKVMVCESCWLVQTEDYGKAVEYFDAEYAYFSSTSTSWLNHALEYVEKIVPQLQLTKDSFVVEIASNDGYLLKNFISKKIPCLGIEPTESTANAAEEVGVPVLREFFGEDLALRLSNQNQKADLIIGNNVYAHVPDINDFTRGLKIALKNEGTITLEFPHLKQLIQFNQFDTIYHEHFSYLSLYTVTKIFESVGLRIWNVEELATHGGSLRVYGCHMTDKRPSNPIVKEIINNEKKSGLQELSLYKSFQKKADKIKNDFVEFLIQQKKLGKLVAAYGAAAKGNTLINYAGIKPDLINFVCDAAPSKQGKYMPGSHLPIFNPTELAKHKPDWVVIFPWNIAKEVQEQVKMAEWGGQFIVAVPELRVIN
jgi:hypothetical protein